MSFLSTLTSIKQYETQILASIKSHRVTIIKGPTGCGKSTYIPFMLSKYKIIIIEPRRIAVISLYNTLKKFIKVGYKVRYASENIHANVMFMTDGMFLNMHINNFEKNISKYEYIIVDEIHERNLRLDLIMIMLRRIENGPKIILMSATVNTNLYQKYFNANVVEIKTKMYNAEIVYCEKPVENYLISSFLAIKNILAMERKKHKIEKEIDDIFDNGKSEYNKDVLIFLPGEEDIHELYKMLKVIPEIKVLKIFGSLNDSEQRRIFENEDMIKVVLSTNICETSLTIPGIKYVIDTGLHKEKLYNGTSYFGIKQIGRDNANQRLGRCNRTEDGVCYRLYTEDTFKKMSLSLPEIVKSDISNFLLSILYHDIDILSLEFLSYPSKGIIIKTFLYLIGIKSVVIIDNLFKITDYGRKLMKYPLDVPHAHFYRFCIDRNATQLGVIILSFITQSNYNFLENEIRRKKSDLEELIILFKEYYETNRKDVFCSTRNINNKYMEKCELIYNQMYKEEEKVIDMSKLTDLKNAFRHAFLHNLSEKKTKSSYRNIKTDEDIDLHRTNYYYKKNVQYLVYSDVFSTGRNYARIVEKYDA